MSRSKPPRYKRFTVLNKPVVVVRIIGHDVFEDEIREKGDDIVGGVTNRNRVVACKQMEL